MQVLRVAGLACLAVGGTALITGGAAAWGQMPSTPSKPSAPSTPSMDPAMGDKLVKPMKEMKVTFISSTGQPAGTGTLKPDKKGGVAVKVELENLPFGPHAIHLHQNADCTGPDFKAAGGHFNPTSKQHGFDNPMGHHAGDVNTTIQVGEDHKGSASFVLRDVTWMQDQPNSLFANGGTSLVVHEKADDQKTDPSGASGNRIACAVVKP